MVFAILHYLDFEVTKKCIDSLLKLDEIDNCKVVVLDNGSNNGSYEQLHNHYLSRDNVLIFKNNNNEGFSSGCNLLYKISKKYNPDYIAIMNNDVVINQKDFLIRLNELIDRYPSIYAVNPDIYSPENKIHQSPLMDSIQDISETEKNMKEYKMILGSRLLRGVILYKKRLKSFLYNCISQELYLKIKKRFSKNSTEKKQLEILFNPVLMGAFIIFTKNYTEKEEVAFEPDTGFYFEELLLALKCKTLNYTTAFFPEIQVLHYCGVSTKTLNRNFKNKEVFTAQKMIHAFNIYKNTYYNNPWCKRVKKTMINNEMECEKHDQNICDSI